MRTLADVMGEAPQPAPGVELRVLGALEVRRHGEVVPIGSTRQRTLLARLLVDAGGVVPVDALVDALWGDEPPADPRNAIQTYVARLRDTLGPEAPLRTRSPGYLLDVGPSEVDAQRFEALLAETPRVDHEPGTARARLDEALGLWRGPAYAEFADGLARAEALRLEERRLVALEQRAACRLALGEAADVAGELETLIAEHPWRERFVELHMRALAALGRDHDALAAFRTYRERLAEETGLEPSPPLTDLQGAILRDELAGEAEPGTSRPAPASTRAKAMPPAVTSLVGRDAEVDAVRVALDAHRLVTLTGPGGVGKTRIAAEIATDHAGEDGTFEEVVWVDLAALSDETTVPPAVAAAAGVDLAHGRANSAERVGPLTDALAGRRLLVVLDNAEHLLEVVAPLAHELVHHAAPVRVLTTSRERLALDNEHVVPVGPLPTEDGDEDTEPPAAVRLFLDRAAATSADVSAELERIGQICGQLDGLPLAIELAAARAGVLPLTELQAALAEDAPGIVGVRRGPPERHRDLWAVVDWSYRLLDAPAQRLFERLSIFAGAFSIDDVHAVCAPEGQRHPDTVAGLAELAEGSLLTHAPDATGVTRRYRMLRPVRAVARQRLADSGDAADVADRHAAAMVARAERAAGPPLTEQGRRWLEAAVDDLRAARGRARLTGDVAGLARLVTAVFWFDYWRPGTELLGWADDVLDMAGDDPKVAGPQVHAAAATAAWMGGDLPAARRLGEQAMALGPEPDDPGRILALQAVGDVAVFEGRLAEAEATFDELVRLARQVGDIDAEANGLAAVALALAYTGRVTDAVEGADDADHVATRAGPAARAFARYARGECRAESDPVAALELVEQAVDLAASCGAWFVEGVARLTAATLRARHEDPAAAAPAYAELLRHWRRSGDLTQQWTTLRNVAELLVRLEVDEPAVTIAAAADTDPSAPPTFGTESDRLERALTTAATRLHADRFDAARARGHHLRSPEVVDVALEAIEALGGATGDSSNAVPEGR